MIISKKKGGEDCVSCGSKIRPIDLRIHPVLSLPHCSYCHTSFLQTGDISTYRGGTDRDGSDNFCRCCGDGGDLILCHEKLCRSGFCNDCVERILGHKRFIDISKHGEEWYCFACDYNQVSKWKLDRPVKLKGPERNGLPPDPKPQKYNERPDSNGLLSDPEPEKADERAEGNGGLQEPESEKDDERAEGNRVVPNPEPEKADDNPEGNGLPPGPEPERDGDKPRRGESPPDPEPQKDDEKSEGNVSPLEPEPEKDDERPEGDRLLPDPAPEKACERPSGDKSPPEPESENDRDKPEGSEMPQEPESEKDDERPEGNRVVPDPEPEKADGRPEGNDLPPDPVQQKDEEKSEGNKLPLDSGPQKGKKEQLPIQGVKRKLPTTFNIFSTSAMCSKPRDKPKKWKELTEQSGITTSDKLPVEVRSDKDSSSQIEEKKRSSSLKTKPVDQTPNTDGHVGSRQQSPGGKILLTAKKSNQNIVNNDHVDMDTIEKELDMSDTESDYQEAADHIETAGSGKRSASPELLKSGISNPIVTIPTDRVTSVESTTDVEMQDIVSSLVNNISKIPAQPENGGESKLLKWALKDTTMVTERVHLFIQSLQRTVSNRDMTRFSANPENLFAWVDNLKTILAMSGSIIKDCESVQKFRPHLKKDK